MPKYDASTKDPAVVTLVKKVGPVESGEESIDDIEKLWAKRRIAMANHRRQFETIWESGIRRFFQGILDGKDQTTNRIYDALYEQYDLSMFSQEGLRFSDLKYPMLHTIVIRAMASEYKNRPSAKFIAVGSNDPTKAIGFTHLFAQVLAEANADQEDFEVFMDRRIRGTAAVLQITDKRKVTIQDPTIGKDGKLTYDKKTKTVSKTGYRKIDLKNLYLDEHCRKSDLSDCKYAMVDEYFGEEDFKDKFGEYGEAKLAEHKATGKDESTDNPFVDEGANMYIKVTHCFDVIKDRYDILVFGKKINDLFSPIPRIAGRDGKEIPISLAVMYKIPDCPYGYGDAHVTGTFNSIKNLVRLMILEITQKSAKKTLAVDPNSPFDEQEFEWGQDFIRVAPEDLKEIAINPNMDILEKLDETSDKDIIQATGINITDTTNTDTNETARKTVIRRESQNAIIELGMDYMAVTYFKRLYNLLKDDIRLHYHAALMRGDKIQVKTDGVKLKRGEKGNLRKYKATGWRYFDLKSDDLDMDMDIVLETGNISVSKQLQKSIAMEGVELTKWAASGFDPAGLAKYIQEEISEMPDYVLASAGGSIESKTPEELANEGLDPTFLPKQQQLINPKQNAQNSKGLAPLPGLAQGAGRAGAPVEQAPAVGPGASRSAVS